MFGISQLKLHLLAIRFTTGLIRSFDIKFALWFDASCDQEDKITKQLDIMEEIFMSLIEHTCVDRFLHYVTHDTQSSEESDTFPSTEKQKDLAIILVQELKEMGLDDAHMDDNGYVMGTFPANVDKKVPVIGLIAHMDTSPAVSGKNVKTQIHKNYQGADIAL